MKRIILFFLFLMSFVSLQAQALPWKFSAGGSFRMRGVYFINKDMDFNRQADFGVADLRGRLKFVYAYSNLFRFVYEGEVGNLNLGEKTLGSSLGGGGVNLETRYFYADLTKSGASVRLGIFGLKTPLKLIVDDEAAGIALSGTFGFFKVSAIYSKLFSGTNELAPNEQNDDFEVNSHDDADYYGLDISSSFLKIAKTDLWFSYLDDRRYFGSLPIYWIGSKFEVKLGDFNANAGGIYNFASVSNTLPLQAFAIQAKGKLKLSFGTFFVHLITLSGNNLGDRTTIGQFQSIDKRASFDNDLSVLFGGGIFGSQSYFDSDNAALRDDNLTTGSLVFDDPGLFLFEGGFVKKIGFYRFKGVVGYVTTLHPINSANLLGIEADTYHEFQVMPFVSLQIGLGGLLPGQALREMYHRNHSSVLLGSDFAFKLEGDVKIKL